MKKVLCGLEKLQLEQAYIVAKRRIGLVSHPAAINSDIVHSLEVLKNAGAKIEILFGPEHGFGGEAQDMELVEGSPQSFRGIPLYSLYGASRETLSPPENLVRGLDALVIDLTDVGSRYYTFIWTTILCLRVCHAAGVELIVLDRPNPLGGLQVEGAPQKSGFLSFVGLLPIPNRHGLTTGEIVRMVARNEGLEDALTIVTMDGWERWMYFEDTGLPWVLPSPNMPTVDTAVVYPGMCLLEGTWASEGRGTTRPFEIFGAPEVNSLKLVRYLTSLKLPGVCFRPTSFKPTFQKHANKSCKGAQLHVTDRQLFKPYLTGVAVLLALKHIAADTFEWRLTPYEFVSDIPAIDLLTGSDVVRVGIESGASLTELSKTWSEGQKDWIEQAKKLHIY